MEKQSFTRNQFSKKLILFWSTNYNSLNVYIIILEICMHHGIFELLRLFLSYLYFTGIRQFIVLLGFFNIIVVRYKIICSVKKLEM